MQIGKGAEKKTLSQVSKSITKTAFATKNNEERLNYLWIKSKSPSYDQDSHKPEKHIKQTGHPANKSQAINRVHGDSWPN